MKTMQRISAAFLTLLMVVTMLPSEAFSAFAATERKKEATPIKNSSVQGGFNADNIYWEASTKENPLGGARMFNAVALDAKGGFGFGGIKNFHEIEGAAAANGDIRKVGQIGFPAGSDGATLAKIPQFNVGLLYTGSANGRFTMVQNGDAVSHFASTLANKVDVSHGGHFFNRYSQADDFFDGKQELKNNSDNLAGMQPTGTTTVNGDTIVFEGKETGVNIFSLEDRILADGARSLNFNVPEGSSVLINVTGSRDNFDILNMQGTWVNGKPLNHRPPNINILWNFNGGESKSINFKKGNMWGSVLAPRAYLSMGDSSGYSTINGNVVAQCIDGNGTNSEIHWWQFKDFDFEKHYNNINFTKVDSADEKALNGAEFTLYTTKYENSVLVKSNEVAKNQAGELIKNVKSTDGKFNIANVPYGTYILEETKVPGGYNKGADVYVVVGKEVTIGNEGAKDVKIANTKKEIKPATFQFYKVGKNGEGLTGAEFEIKGVVGSQTSTGTFLPGDDGKVLFDNLFAGTYVITETKAPKNYKLSDKAIKVTVETKEEDKEIVCVVTSVKMGTVGKNGEFDAANAVEMPTDEKKIINKDNEFVFANELKKADLQVSKTDAETDILIMTANAKFALYSDKGCKNQVGDTVTTREGVATFKDLVCGKTYYLKEIEAPNGYVLSENVMPIKITFDGVKTITGNKVTVENSKKTGEFTFTKVDENGEPLMGATFKLCLRNGENDKEFNLDEQTSNKNGTVTFKNLRAGTDYFIEEIVAPNGYGVDNKKLIRIHLDEDAKVTIGWEGANGDPANYTFANAPLETDFTFFKREISSNQPIMGIKFTLTNNETGTVLNATSLEKGKVTFNGLTAGTYTLHEENRYGYKIMGDFKIEVKNEKNVLKIYPENGYMTLTDTENILYNEQLTADFSFTKIANDTGKGLDGALFMISLNNSAAEGQTFDNAKGGKFTFKDLICGVYTIVEARAPANYGKEDGKIYTVIVKPDPSGKFAVATCDEIANEAGENIIVNNRLTAVYEFIKKDSLTNAPIEGVEFELKANDETSVVTLESDSTGKVTASNLLAGKTYTITEKTPASGYTNNGKSITVTVDSEGTATASAADNNEFNTESYIWTNNKITGDVSFNKIDENNESLANAEFTLYQKDTEGNLVTVQKDSKDVTAKSNGDGVVTFNGLRANESYTIKETTAPKGYKLSDVAIEVSVDATGKATIKSGVDNVAVPDSEIKNAFRNELIKGSYQFTKVANDGITTLSDAKFTMTEKQNIMTRNSSAPVELKSDANGIVSTGDLLPGVYTIKETKAPTYYMLDETTEMVVTVAEDGTTTATVNGETFNTSTYNWQNTPISVSFEKVDEDGVLKDVVFGLYTDENATKPVNINGTDVTAISDENGVVTFTGLKTSGNYYVKEISTVAGHVLNTGTIWIFVSNTGVAGARVGLTDTDVDADGDLDEFVNKKTDSYTFRKVGDELAPLNGVTFKVLEKMADGTTKEFANVTSNAEGKVTVEGLSTGKTYVVRETGVGENADYLVSNKTFELTVNADGSVDSTIREADHFFFNKKVPSAEGEITEQKKLDVEHFYFDPNVSKEDEYVDPKADKYEDNKVYFEGFVRTLNNKDPFNQYSYSIMGNPELNVTVLPVLNPVIPNEEQLNYIKLAEDGTVVQAFTDDELVMKELGLTDLTSLTPTAEAQTAFDAAQATYDAAVKALEDAQKTITDKAATIAALDAELAQLNEDLLAAQIALNTAENEDPQVEEKVLAAMSAVANAETSIITKNMEIVDANAIVTATEEEIATLTAAVTAAQTALTDATTALEDSKKQSAEYLDALAFAKAKIEKQIEAYNALCAQVVTRNEELNAGLAAATTVQTDENGKSYFNYQSGYSYTVVYKYTRPTPETPVDPPIPPVDPPIPPVNPPVTPPVTPPVIPPVIIPDDPTPLGPVPRRKIYDDPTPTGFLPKRSGLYLIADDETPLGALPHTSGNRAAAAGAMGVITLLAGSLLGLFGKKKK